MSPPVDAAHCILNQPAPVLLPDTCALLDLLRGPARLTAGDLRAAIAVWDGVAGAIRRVHLLMAEMVQVELQHQRQAADDEFRAFTNRWSQATLTLEVFAELLGGIGPGNPQPVVADLQSSLTTIYDGLLSAALCLEHDRECDAAAADRIRDRTAPAHRGGYKDAVITEQYLKACRWLRSQGFSAPIAFLTSNTRDFCDSDGRTLHPGLAADFDSANLILCVTWSDARYALGQ